MQSKFWVFDIVIDVYVATCILFSDNACCDDLLPFLAIEIAMQDVLNFFVIIILLL